MARGVHAVLGSAVEGGLVIAPHGTPATAVGPIVVRTGAHPIPDAPGLVATAALIDLVRDLDAGTLLVGVLSGGASALLTAPADGLTLDDVRETTAALVAAGAEIGPLNAVRKHCSRISGGQLAALAARAAGCWALVLSDVVGDDPATVASGPTVADPTTYAAALGALDRYGVTPGAAVRAHLERGARGGAPETPKPGDPRLARAHTRIVAGNADAVTAAATAARARGYATTLAGEALLGEAAAAGERLAATLLATAGAAPVAIVAGGETTVRARPGGVGGRCQHLAVAAARRLEGTDTVLLAAGTDGVDGPTAAAGGCVDGGTVARARAAGLDPEAVLAATDAHRLLAATGDLVVTGPTGTNVADLVVAMRAPA
jgi:glycerate-2-kinase